MALRVASDGLPAREVQPWSDEKLFYVERYMRIFTTGMKNRWPRRVYADLFSGPGLCINDDGDESLGSPLRALSFDLFTHLFFNDIDPDAVAALKARVGDQPGGRVEISQRDCNDAVDAARRFLFPVAERRQTLGLAFVDPTAYQVRFESIERLAADVRVDLIITFMTSYARRFIGQAGFDEGSAFDEFMGTRVWRRLGISRPTVGFTSQLLDIYKQQLRGIGYQFVDHDRTPIRNTRGQTLYHLVFASKHAQGEKFFRAISQRRYTGQRLLDL